MADEEEYEEGIVEKKKDRPVRRINMRECDVNAALQAQIVEFAQQALDEETGKQKTVAQFVKQKLDQDIGGTWHCIVGCNFGGNVTNDAGTLLNFQIDSTWFLVFRSGPPEKGPEQ